jgi:hypothetical protein
MSLLSSLPVIGQVLDKVFNVIDQAVPDKDMQEKLKAEMQNNLLQLDYKAFETEIDARARIIATETQGQSSLQRNWRPILMLVIVAIVANNYLIAPYMRAMGVPAPQLDLPSQLWDLMSLGVGGYVLGRTGEKVATAYLEAKKVK